MAEMVHGRASEEGGKGDTAAPGPSCARRIPLRAGKCETPAGVSLNQFFGYFGSKHGLARRYPPPRHDVIIEPFAGSAGYATRHHRHRVILVEKSPVVAGVWRYLIRSSVRDILSLPDLADGQSARELDVCEEARALIGFWLGFGDAAPRYLRSTWMVKHPPDCTWGRTIRARLASQVDKIRHWQIIEGSYESAPDVQATWFVDPPYEVAGHVYTCPSAELDFAALGAWCRARRGQVVVCENAGAEWLPFRPFRALNTVSNTPSTEAIWTNDIPPSERSR